MSTEIHDHISRSLRTDARLDFALAAGSLFGGLAILAVSFFAVFVAAWAVLFILPIDIGDPSPWAYAAGGAVLLLAFVESWRSQRRLFEGFDSAATAGGTALSAGLYFLGVGYGPRGIIPLSPGTSKNLVKVIADLLYSGPRLLRNSVRWVRRGRARAAADYQDCAEVLSLALRTSGRLSFDEIERRRPEIDLPSVMEQLSWLNGIIYLKNDPAGIALTDDLREKLEEVDFAIE